MGNNIPNGRVPMSVLNNLNEHTLGGFAIFYFNAESGFPEHVLTFDSPVHSLAMQKYLQDWVDGLRQLNIEMTKQQIIDNSNEDENN